MQWGRDNYQSYYSYRCYVRFLGKISMIETEETAVHSNKADINYHIASEFSRLRNEL